MIEIIGGLWAANETKTFVINGEYLEILEAQYPCDVMLMDKTGAQLSIMRRSEASFFSRPKEGFQTVQITSVQPQQIRVFIGSGDAGTRRISSTVSVIDGARARVDANVANAVALVMSAPGVGNYAATQLFNPAGSGRRLVVNALSLSLGTASGANIYFATAALTVNFSASTSCKKSQAAAASAVPWVQALTVAPVFTYGLLQQVGGSPGVYTPWRPTEPLIVMPGFGLNIAAQNTDTGLYSNFEWFEEVI